MVVGGPTRRSFLTVLTVGTAVMPRTPTAASPILDGPACFLTPQLTQGPFYLNPKLVRADVTEGRPGVPLELRFHVVATGACTPVVGARIDLWHCDARGLYSGFPGQGDGQDLDTTGQTFLRGTQMTDAAGNVAFRSIYPGWYVGRATHAHFKVILGSRSAAIGQVFFPDALSASLYAQVPAYGGRRFPRDVVNANDRFVREAGPHGHVLAAVREDSERYFAALTIGIRSGPHALR